MRDEVSEGLNCRKFYFQQVKVLKGKNLISIGQCSFDGFESRLEENREQSTVDNAAYDNNKQHR